jgi:hypothetical protein
MFITYTGPSEKSPGTRGAINAFTAANASLKRQRQRDPDTVITSLWLHDRPLILSQPQQQVRAGVETSPEEAFDEEFYLREEAIQWPVGDGVRYPVPKKTYYPALLFQRQYPQTSFNFEMDLFNL